MKKVLALVIVILLIAILIVCFNYREFFYAIGIEHNSGMVKGVFNEATPALERPHMQIEDALFDSKVEVEENDAPVDLGELVVDVTVKPKAVTITPEPTQAPTPTPKDAGITMAQLRDAAMQKVGITDVSESGMYVDTLKGDGNYFQDISGERLFISNVDFLNGLYPINEIPKLLQKMSDDILAYGISSKDEDYIVKSSTDASSTLRIILLKATESNELFTVCISETQGTYSVSVQEGDIYGKER